MRLALFCAIILACLTGACAGPVLGTYSVSANGTFLERGPHDDCSFGMASKPCNPSEFAPTVVQLSTLGLFGGMAIQIEGLGDFCFTGDPATCQLYGAYLVGAFSATNHLNVLGNQRLPDLVAYTAGGLNGGVAAGKDLQVYYGGNMIQGLNGVNGAGSPSDFMLEKNNIVTLIIPQGAQYLFVGVLHSRICDSR
jgi:hypothetical protein